MKKILLTAATVASLSAGTAFAGEQNTFYVKANGGWSKLNKIDKVKSKNDFFLGLGVGYYVMDNVRTDLVLEHLFNPAQVYKSKDKRGYNFSNKLEAKINSLILNGYVDLFDAGVAKFFVGAGFGVSQVSAKFKQHSDDPIIGDESVTLKKKINFSYAGHVGASAELAPGVNGEATYSFRGYGKAKDAKEDGETILKAKAYKGHQVGVGVRFDI